MVKHKDRVTHDVHTTHVYTYSWMFSQAAHPQTASSPIPSHLSVEPAPPEELVPGVGLQEVHREALGHTTPHNRTDGFRAPGDKDLRHLPAREKGEGPLTFMMPLAQEALIVTILDHHHTV